MNHSRRNFVSRPKKLAKRREAARNNRRTLGGMERLEDRRLLAGNLNPWHNDANPLDVNGDANVGPIDVLTVVNSLNQYGSGQLGDLIAYGPQAAAAEGETTSGTRNPEAMVDVNADKLLTPSDAIQVINRLNAEGEDTKLVRVSARLTTNAPLRYAAIPGTNPPVRIWWPVIDVTGVSYPVRTDMATANPGDTILLNVFAEDIRTDDGIGANGLPGPYTDADQDGIDDTDAFGVYAAYLDATYPAGAFVIAPGTSNSPIKTFNFPIDFGNPRDVTSFDDGLDPPQQTLSTEHYNYPNGPSGDASVAGLIDEAGGFSNLSRPVGHVLELVPANQKYIFNVAHVFSVPFVVQSYITANYDGGSVPEGQSKQLDPLSAVQMVGSATGTSYSFNVDPAEGDGGDVLVFGAVGEPGTGGTGSVVDPKLIDWAGDSVNVVNTRTLTITNILDAPDKGTVQIVANKLVYTPTAPGTDTMVYGFTDGVTTSSATVTVTVTAVNDTPTLDPINNVTKDEDPGEITVNLTGITAGGTESQPLAVTAVSNNTTLIPNITVGYTSPDTAGTLKFTPAPNQNGSAVVTVTVTDGGFDGNLATTTDNGTVSKSFTVTVNAVNDAPVNTVPTTTQTVIETALLPFAPPISVTDVEALAENKPVQVNLGVTNGKLNLTNTANLTNLTGLGTSAVSYRGTVAAVNAALATLTYQANTFPQNDTLTITTSDLGTSPLPVTTRTDQVPISVLPSTKPAAVPDNYTVDEGSGAHTFDVLANDINLAGVVGGGNLQITEVTQGSNGGTVAINGTTITYTRTDDFFSNPAPETFTYTTADATDPDAGDGPSTTTVSVIVNGINDSPAITASPTGVATPEEAAFVFSGANSFTVADVDADAGGGLKVTVGVSHGTLTAPNGTVTVTGANTGSLTISGLVAAVNTSLAGLTYNPTKDYAGQDTLSFVVDDMGHTGGGSAAQTVTRAVPITVNPVNDAPTITAPTAEVVTTENTALQFLASGPNKIALNDVDNATVTVGLTVTNGTLKLQMTTGLTFNSGADSTAAMNFTGTLANINAALDGMRYNPAQNYEGPATLGITAGDGEFTAQQNVGIIVSGVNDPPVNNLPATAQNNEDTPLAFTGANLISITDVDAGTGNIQVNVAVTNGVFTLNPAANMTGVTVVGNATGSVSMTGPLATINGGLNGSEYSPTANFNTTDSGVNPTLTIITNDKGYTGTGGEKTDTDTMTITVNSVNDNPTAVNDYSAANPLLVLENSSTQPLAVLANDSFAPDKNETLTITGKTNGARGTVTISADGKTVTYAHTSGTLGADSFTYTISDGNGGSATATVFVSVVNFVPSDLSGKVYLDDDNDGKADDGELGVGGVLITLTGTDVQGNPVNLTQRTDAHGMYVFGDVLPSQAGTPYVLKEQQPFGLVDGKDAVGDQGEADGAIPKNDQFSVALPLFGYATGITGYGNCFGELSFTGEYAGVYLGDLLHNGLNGGDSLATQGLLIGVDAAGRVEWWIDIGDGWAGWVPVDQPVVGGGLRVRDTATGVVHTFQPLDPQQIVQQSGTGGGVIRACGDVALDFAELAGESESAAVAAALVELGDGEEDAAQFAQAADTLFAGLGDLI